MPFSEDDLRDVMKRKDPGPDFTRRVMQRVSQADAGRKSSTPKARWGLRWFAGLRFSPALVAASIAILLLLGSWIGYQSYRRHQEQARIEQQKREAEEQKAEQQALLALRIASEKLNHVFQKVNVESLPDDKIRRQRL